MSRGLRVFLLTVSGVVALGVLVGAFALSRTPAAPADVSIITHGEEVDLAAHAVAGKHTVFDFYAVWCPPCRALGPALETLAQHHPDRLAIRKVDIVDWTMPVAKQYGVEELPWLVLYDENGRKIAEGEKVFEALDALFGKDAAGLAAATRPTSTEM